MTIDPIEVDRLVSEFDTADEARKSQIQWQLSDYRDQQLAIEKKKTDQHYEDLYTKPEYFEQINKSDLVQEAAKLTPFADETGKRAANQSYLAYKLNVPVESLEDTYEIQRDGYAQANFGKTTVGDDEFYGLVKGQYDQKIAEREYTRGLVSDVLTGLLEDTATGERRPVAERFNNWLKNFPRRLDPEKEHEFLRNAFDLYDSQSERMSRYAPEVRALYQTLAGFSGVEGEQVGDETVRALAENFAAMPKEDRMAVYGLAALYAEKNGQDKGFWRQLGESVIRSVGGIYQAGKSFNVENPLRRELNELERPIAKNPKNFRSARMPEKFAEMTPEQREEYKAKLRADLEKVNVAREMFALANGEIDPIETTWPGLMGDVEQGLYSAAGSIPYIAVAGIPYVGVPAAAAAYSATEYDRMRLEYPDLEPESVLPMALASGGAQSLLDKLQFETITGKLPITSRILERFAKSPGRSFAARVAAATSLNAAEQYGQETLQNITPIVVEETARALGQDLPDRDWSKELEMFKDGQVQTFFALLPLVLIGSGAIGVREYKRGAQFLSDVEQLKGFGIGEQVGQKIAATYQDNPEAAQEQFAKAFSEVSDAKKKKIVKATDKTFSDAEEVSNSGFVPTITLEPSTDKDGNPIEEFVVKDSSGREVLRNASEDIAIEAQREVYQAELIAKKQAVSDMVAFYQSQGASIEVSEEPKLFSEADIPIEQLADRMRIAGLSHLNPDQVSILGETTVEKVADDAYKTTIKLYQGANPLTVIEEFAEGKTREALAANRVSMDWLRSQVDAYSEATGEVLPSDTDQAVIEGVSKLAQAYVTGRLRDERLPTGLKGFFVQMVEFFKDVFARAGKLRKAFTEGKIDANFESHLAESVGLSVDRQVENATGNAMGELIGGKTFSIGEVSKLSREEFLGNPTITKNSNASDLIPSEIKSLKDEASIPFKGGLDAKYNEDGAAVFDDGKVIASYNFGDTLVVDKKYRGKGIAKELVYQWRKRFPNPAKSSTRTQSAQAIQESVWERIQSEKEFETTFSIAQTETPAFKNWFKDSKVVDSDGKPLVVYHGTKSDEDFSIFNPRKGGSNFGRTRDGDSGFVFFTSGDADPDWFNEQKNRGPSRVYPVFVSLQKPLEITASSREEARKNPMRMFEFQPSVLWDGNSKQLSKKIREGGYDGAIIRGTNTDGSQEIMIIARKSNQIKSAIGNQGTFDPSNPDITFSISPTDTVKKLEKELNKIDGNPELRKQAVDKARQWLKNIEKWQIDAESGRLGMGKDRVGLIAALGQLEAITSILPKEARGRIPAGYKLATLSEGERLPYLRKRVQQVNKELEKFLKEQYREQLKKLFKKASVTKGKPGEKPKGKAGAELHSLFDTLKEAVDWTPEQIEGHITKLESEITSGELSTDQVALKTIEQSLVMQFGDWKNADSERMAAAIQNGNMVWDSGYYQYKIKMAELKEARDNARTALITDAGKTGTDVERKQKLLAENSLPSGWSDVILNLANFEQLLKITFGDNSVQAQRLADMERNAYNAKQDAMMKVIKAVDDFSQKIAGGELAGQRLIYRLSQPSIEAPTRNGNLPMSEMEAIDAILTWRREQGKMHMLGQQDDKGQYVSDWHYNQAFVDHLENALSSEGRQFLNFIASEYASEYEGLNAIYRELNGVNLPQNANYSPISVTPLNPGKGEMVDPVTGNVISAGSTIPGSLRTLGSRVAQPQFKDALKKMLAHKMQIEHWKAYAGFVNEANAILNNRALVNSVEASGGTEAASVLRKWIDYFAQGGNRDAAASLAINGMLNRLMGRFASVALVGRLGTLAIQSTQLGAAIAEMPTGAYIKRLSGLLTGQMNWLKAIDSPYIQRRIAAMPPIVRLAMEGLRAEEPNILRHNVEKLAWLIGGTDALFTAGTYAMVYDYQLSQAKSLGLTGAEAESYAQQAAERSVDRIAQPTRPGTRSLSENLNTGPFARMAWAFGSESRKNLALMAYTLAKRPAAHKARVLAYVFLINGTMASIIRNGWRDLRDDEDEEVFDEKHWSLEKIALTVVTEPLYGFPVIGEAAQDAAFAAAGVYQPGGGPLSRITRAIPAIRRLDETLTGQQEMYEVLRDVEAILSAFGLLNSDIAAAASLSHLARDLYGVGANIAPDEE